MSELAANLRVLRGSMSQSAFAKQLGIKQQTYANYELGVREPDIDTLIRIARLVGKSVDTLVGSQIVGDRSADKVADLKKAILTLLKEY